MIMNKVNNKSAKAAPVMLIIGILFIAANLRAPLTSVGPLVSLIRDNLHISNTLAGTITSLPLFAFALFSPLIPGMARKFGTEVCFFGSVIILTLGILLRSYAGSFSLFLGTAIIGLAISASNVLMPSLIKKRISKSSRSYDRPLLRFYEYLRSTGFRHKHSSCSQLRIRLGRRIKNLGRP